MEKEVKIFGVVTTRKQLIDSFWQNFIYGFLAGCLPTAIALKNDWAIFILALLFYGFLSIILNRPAYKTKLGRFIIFPGTCSIGFFLAYKVLNLIL